MVSVGSSSTSPRVASVTKMYFTVPPNGVAKLHFGAHFQAPGLPNQTAGTVDVYGLQILDATLEAGNTEEEDTAASALLLKHKFLDGGADDARAPGALVAHEAAVQRVVDVVGLGHVHHEVGGRAEPVAAGEEQLSPGRQVVGAHDVPRVRRQGQGVAVHAHSRGVRGQDHAAAAAGANRPV